MPKESKHEQKLMPVDLSATTDLVEQIGVLTQQVIDSYQDPTQTHTLGSRLSQLHDLLVSGLLEDSEKLTDAYLSCGVRLLNRVLRDNLTTQQFLQEVFASQRHQQTPFFQTLYWALLRPWLRPASGGALSSYRHLEGYIDDLRQRATRSEDAKWFDNFTTRIGSDTALHYAWECCLQALQLLPRLGGWKHGAQIFQALIRPFIKLPALPDLVPSEAKTAWGIIELTASFGSNIYRYATDHPNTDWHAPVIDIQVTVHHALRDHSSLPPLHLALSYSKRWQVFWAVTVANETVLCSPLSTYEQCRQAMGDPLDASSAEQANLFGLIRYWLTQPTYANPECQAALAQTLRRLLDPQTPLAPWLRHQVYHAWEALKPWLIGERAIQIKKEIEEKIQVKQRRAWEKLEEEAHRQQAPFHSDRSLRRHSLVAGIHESMAKLQDHDHQLVGTSFRRQLYQKVQPVVASWLDEKQIAFHVAAAQGYQTQTLSSDPYTGRIDAYTHLHHAAQATTTSGSELAEHHQQLLTRALLADLAQTYTELLVSSLLSQPPFASILPQSEKNARWAEEVHQTLFQYVDSLHPLLRVTQELCQWQLSETVSRLWQPLAQTQRLYLSVYDQWVTWANTLEAKTPEELVWSSRCAARQEDYHHLEARCNAYGLATFFYQKAIQEKPESLPLPSHSPWQAFNRRFKEKDYGGGKEDKYEKDRSSTLPWLTQIADWLDQRLPRPPCPFKPFVLLKTGGHFLLGIELTDHFYRHHPFFSHWAEWFKIGVGVFSDFTCTIDVSAVSHFGRERSSAIVLDGVGTHRELVRLSEFKLDHWRYQTAPMIYLTPTPQQPLDLHGHLQPEDKTGLRPHTVALNQQWQRNLYALTTPVFDSKAPAARLQWSESKEPRYLNAALTHRLFHTEGQLEGQRPVWRLTAADACQFLPEYAGDTILVYAKANPHHLWRQWQHLGLMQRLIDYGHTGTIASLQYGRADEDKPDQFKPVGDPVPVWLSSPAGLTFCTLDESKDSPSMSDVEVMDETGQPRFIQSIAQLDPRYFTQAVFLTWLLVHEDDQLRNLGFEPLVNTQGEGAFRLIPFDTDTALEAPWIRLPDGRVQIKLKSLLFCLDAMQRPLDASAIRNFLALEPETILESWLTPLAKVKMTPNRLPAECIDALYLRWQRFRQVLTLSKTASDPMAPLLPRSHLELLVLLDPVLGQAYQQAFTFNTDSLQRFAAVSQDYVRVSGVSISASSGLLRGESVTQARSLASPTSVGMTPQQALQRCVHYRQENQQILPLLKYLTDQASTTDAEANARFEIQMNAVAGSIQALNQETQKQLEQRLRLKSEAERTATYLSQWEPIATPGLAITVIIPEVKTSLTPAEWQTNCMKTATPGLWVSKDIPKTWQIKIYNGQRLIVSDTEDSGWDLKPLYQALETKPEPATIRQAVQQIYLNQLQALKKIQQDLKHSEIMLKKLTQQRQEQLLRQSKEIKAWYELPPKHPQFLTGLLEMTLRRTIISRLSWGTLPMGKGLQQMLRLLELGGLIELNLQDCTAVTDAHLIALVQNSPELTAINLSGCVQITSTGILRLADGALYLTRLSARTLPKLTDLWRGLIWTTHSPLVFPKLTHADFSGCGYLRRIDLQAPKLQYLSLNDCDAPLSLLDNALDWTVTAPKLRTLSLAGCMHLLQIKINSEALENLNLSRIKAVALYPRQTWLPAITFNHLCSWLTPLQWAGIRTLHFAPDLEIENRVWFNHYPWLIPLIAHASNDQLLELKEIFSKPQTAALLASLSRRQQEGLQIGLVLFCWQQQQDKIDYADKAFNRLISLLDYNQHLRSSTVEVIDKIVSDQPQLAKTAFNCLSSLLKDSNLNIRYNTAKSVSKIVSAQPQFAETALNLLSPLFLIDFEWSALYNTAEPIGNAVSAHPLIAEKTLNLLSEHLKRSTYIPYNTAKIVGNIASAHPQFAETAFNLLCPLLKHSNSHVSRNTAEAIGNIASGQPQFTKAALSLLSLLLKRSNSDVSQSTTKAIGTIVSTQPQFAEAALNLLSPLLKDSDWHARYNTVEAIGNIIFTQPLIAETAFNLLRPRLRDSYWNVRRSSAEAIGNIVSAQPQFAETAFNLLSPLLKDFYPDIRLITTLGKIVSAQPRLAEAALNLLSPLLKHSNSDVRRSTVEVIGNTISAQPLIAETALNLLSPLLIKDSNSHVGYSIAKANVRDSIAEAIGKIVSAQPQFAETAFNLLSPLFKDFYPDVRLITTIGKIVSAQPRLAEAALNLLSPLLKHSNSDVRRSTAEAIVKIVSARPRLAETALNLLSPLFKDFYKGYDSNILLIPTIGEIVSVQPRLSETALNLLRPLLWNHDRDVRLSMAGVISKIVSVQPLIAETALNLLILSPFLKHSYWDNGHSTAELIPNIVSAQPRLAEIALNFLIPLLKGTNSNIYFYFEIVEIIQKITLYQPTVIYRFLALFNQVALLTKQSDSDRFFEISVIFLFFGISQFYHFSSNNLSDYIHHFLDKCGITIPLDEKSSSSPKESTSLSKPKEKSQPPLTALTTLGDDRSLAQHGHQRNYWYSISDLYLLTTKVRQQHLVYFLPNESKQEYRSPGGERYSAFRQNRHSIFIADPYVQIGACRIPQFLAEDIAIITGTHEIFSRRHLWTAMPKHLFFTFWHHAHWQLIRIEIDYQFNAYIIRWDNPFGAMPLSSLDKDIFSEPFYIELTCSIKAAIQTLFKTHRSALTTTSDSKLELKSVRQVKTLDQQGWGKNGYDCGPIVIQNLEDYVAHASKDQPLAEFKDTQFTIPVTSSDGWEQKLVSARIQHFEYARKSMTAYHTLSTNDKRLTTQHTALLQQAQAKQQALTLPEIKSDSRMDELIRTISKLSTPQLGVLFTQIDYQRFLLGKSLDEPYSPMELQSSYELLISTTDIQTMPDKSTDSPRTSIMAFFPSSFSPSSSSASSCSSSLLCSSST